MIGFFLKGCLVVLAIIFSPVLFVFAILFIALVIATIAIAIGGGALLYEMLPLVDWTPLASVSPLMTVVGSLGGVVMVGIPLAAIIYTILRQIFHWSPMATGLKWSLFILWLLGVALFLINLSALGWQLPLYGIHTMV